MQRRNARWALRLATGVVRMAVVGVLLTIVACGGEARPTAPSTLPTDSTTTSPPAVPVPPRLDAPVSFTYSDILNYRVRHYTAESKYVLYDGSAFTLQYLSLGFEYTGTYARDDAQIIFRFDGDARWTATGTLNGDLLEVRYNIIMELSDFENAIYRRADTP